MNTTPQANNDSAKPSSRRKWGWLLVLLLVLGIGYVVKSRTNKPDETVSTSGKGKRGASSDRPTPVVTATAKLGDINVYSNGLGAVTPLATVLVKTRVDGEIMKIYFKEGQMVKAGDVLAQIDPRPFQAAFTQAEGQLKRDKALLANAKLDLARYQTLQKQDAIASQQVDTQAALVQQNEGTVKIDEGLFATAKLNLDYTKVTAPISGRVGLRQVDVGNVIHAGDANGFVIITQLQPMSVVFSLPEDAIPDVAKKMKVDKKIQVTAFDRAFKNPISAGTLQTIDNQIDPTTGMVKLRAEFANTDFNLFPSQFVNAQVLLEAKHNVIVVPSAGVQHGKNGSFTFVVNSDQTVNQRTVVVGTVEGNRSEIVSGLNAGEVVVTDGVDKLRDGAKVDTSANSTPTGKHKAAHAPS